MYFHLISWGKRISKKHIQKIMLQEMFLEQNLRNAFKHKKLTEEKQSTRYTLQVPFQEFITSFAFSFVTIDVTICYSAITAKKTLKNELCC